MATEGRSSILDSHLVELIKIGNMIRSEYCEKSKILFVEMRGLIGIEEMLGFAKCLVMDSFSYPSFNVLEDATNAQFDFLIENTHQIMDIMDQHLGKFCCIRHAMVRETPREIAYGIWYEKKNRIENYTTQVFSTKQRAIDWLAEF